MSEPQQTPTPDQTPQQKRPGPPARSNSDAGSEDDQGYQSRSRSQSRRRRRQNQRQRVAQGKAQSGNVQAESMASIEEQPEEQQQQPDKSKWLKNPETRETTETQPFERIPKASEGMMGPVTYARMMRGEIPWRGPPPSQPYETTQGVDAKTSGPDPMDQDGLKLRIELNLDIEIELKASIHGDLTLALLSTLYAYTRSSSGRTHLTTKNHQSQHRLFEDTVVNLCWSYPEAFPNLVPVSTNKRGIARECFYRKGLYRDFVQRRFSPRKLSALAYTLAPLSVSKFESHKSQFSTLIALNLIPAETVTGPLNQTKKNPYSNLPPRDVYEYYVMKPKQNKFTQGMALINPYILGKNVNQQPQCLFLHKLPAELLLNILKLAAPSTIDKLMVALSCKLFATTLYGLTGTTLMRAHMPAQVNPSSARALKTNRLRFMLYLRRYITRADGWEFCVGCLTFKQRYGGGLGAGPEEWRSIKGENLDELWVCGKHRVKAVDLYDIAK